MKWMVLALLVSAVNGRPQGSPPCGQVDISCKVDQVLIYDETQNQCACVSKVYEIAEPIETSDSRRKRQDDEDEQEPVAADPDQQQKPVPLPDQEAVEDPIKRQSGEKVCKDPLHNPAKKRQGVEKPALAVDPVEVVNPVKPVKPVLPVQTEERPAEEEAGEGQPDVDVDTKPAPPDQGSDRRRRQSDDEEQQVQVKPEEKPAEVFGQTRPLPLPSIEGQPGQSNPDPEVQVGVVETKPAPSEGQGEVQDRPPVAAVPLPGVVVKPGDEVDPAAKPDEPAGGKPVTIPAPATREAKAAAPQRPTAERFRPKNPFQQRQENPLDFPDFDVPAEQLPADGQPQPVPPVAGAVRPQAGAVASFQPGNDFDGERQGEDPLEDHSLERADHDYREAVHEGAGGTRKARQGHIRHEAGDALQNPIDSLQARQDFDSDLSLIDEQLPEEAGDALQEEAVDGLQEEAVDGLQERQDKTGEALVESEGVNAGEALQENEAGAGGKKITR